jgi:hypothetical protein
MKLKGWISAAALGTALVAGGALAQDTTTKTTTVQTNTVTVTGPVVRYTPGQTIVIKSGDNKEVTYSLGADLDVPADVTVGRSVTLYTEPMGGTTRVTRIVSTGGTSSSPQTTTYTTTSTSDTGAPVTEVVTVSGTVQTYEPGRSITIVKPDGSQVTYTIDAQSALPQKLTTGKTVTIRTKKGKTVERVTYTTTIK